MALERLRVRSNLLKCQFPASAVTVPLLNGEYIIKLKDDVTRKKSSTAVSAVVNIPDATSKRTVLNIREDTTTPPFSSGSFTRGVFYSDVYGGLVLTEMRWG